MSFESKRLRVQIPCVDESVVELPTRTIGGICGNADTLPRTFCQAPTKFCEYPSNPECTYHTQIVTCALHRTGCFYGTPCGFVTINNCRLGTRPDCGPGSWVIDDPEKWIEVEVDHENPGSVLMRPEDLQQLRSQLESELENSERLQGEVRGQLEELDSIEGRLQERTEE
jgi:hypothetical protein